MPYPYLAMFCIFWLATIGSGLFPDKGMFAAALVVWGGFGSLFTLAQRADAGRSVSISSRLQAALFLGGLTAFWGGFLVIQLMHAAAGGNSAR